MKSRAQRYRYVRHVAMSCFPDGVSAPPTLSYATPQSWTYGAAITPVSPTTTGATSFAVQSGALPTGVSLNTSTGEITGTPTAWAASGSVTIRATGAGGTADSTINWTMAFVPVTFGTCELWLKADGTLWQDSGRTTPVTADADPVGAADDANGSNHLIQATGGSRPTYKATGGATGTGGKRFLFDGVDDFLAKAGLNAGASFMLCVLSTRTSVANRYILGGKAAGAGSIITGYAGDAEFYGAVPRIVIAATDAIPTGFHSICAGGDAGGMTTRLDGGAGGSSGTAAPTLDGDLTVGAAVGGGGPLAGSISEVLVYTTYSSASLIAIDAYLNARR